jgi:hypothetical protein
LKSGNFQKFDKARLKFVKFPKRQIFPVADFFGQSGRIFPKRDGNADKNIATGISGFAVENSRS